MKSCLRIPRVFLPEEGFEKWAVIAGSRFASDRGYWERLAKQVGDAPSALRFILPKVYLGEADGESYARIRESMFEALESGAIDKLNRGFIFVKRTTPFGVRRGIVASVDLEQYSSERGESAPVRPAQEILPSDLSPLVALRRSTPLECPHTMLFYRDKRDKVMRMLEKEDLECLYDFDLLEGGGHLAGYFIPEDLSEEIAHMLRARTEPGFAVAEGNHFMAAAKAYWEEVKETLSSEERKTHPARFTLAELVNLYEDAAVLCPVHRLIEETDRAAFCDFFMKNVPCKREDGLLIPLAAGADGVRATDEVIARYVRANGGKVLYIRGEEELRSLAALEDCAGVLLSAPKKEEIFPALKGGKTLPRACFSVGGERDIRYCVESREIGYD